MGKKPDQNKPWILSYSGFKDSEVVSSGGVTGSGRAKNKITGKLYQLKNSIKDASLLRKAQDGGKDHENFGEVIASSVARALTGSDIEGNTQAVPKVFLVVDKERGRALAASEHLPNVQGTLDDYAKEKDGVKQPEKIVKKATKKKKAKVKKDHVKVSFSEKSNPEKHKFGLAGDDRATLRKDIADGMAIDFLSGNHDVNPGNFLITKENGVDRARPIDFGKAFNKLLETSESFGGQVRNKDNHILDSLNRETVGHLKKGHRTTKLWRDYEGLVPSQELADSFAKLGNAEGLQKGLDQGKANFLALLDEFKDNPKVIKHITDSLQKINKNVGGYEITTNDPKTIVDQVFDNVGTFYKTGQEQMKDVSKLIQLQVDVDKSIKEPNNKELQEKIKKDYEELKDKKGIKSGEGIEWVKNSKDKPAFKGTLDEYIKERTAELALKKEGVEKESSKAKNSAISKPKHFGRERSNAQIDSSTSRSDVSSTSSEPQLQKKSMLMKLAEKFRSSNRNLGDKIKPVHNGSTQKTSPQKKSNKDRGANR